MKIVHLASECSPYAKAGGLGDVVSGLSQKLSHFKNNTVQVIIPRYRFITPPQEHTKEETLQFYIYGIFYEVNILRFFKNQVEMVLIEYVHPHPFFNRDAPYSADGEFQVTSYLFFVRAAMEFLCNEKNPFILHMHDWHAAIAPLMIKTSFPYLRELVQGTVLTIHNLEFQGQCDREKIEAVGISQIEKFDIRDEKNPEFFNLLKSGILYADQITTVSKNYAEEIQTIDHGWWLEGVLYASRHKLTGILNGIDENIWNPKNDPFVSFNYSSQDTSEVVSQQKQKNKTLLQEKFGFTKSNIPLLVSITRLSTQKAPDLILCGMEKALLLGFQCLVIGSHPSHDVYLMLKSLSTRPNAAVDFGFNEHLAHLAYAAADAILIPSYFEPCGLTQLIGHQYGSIPIVRKTGGLKESVSHLNDGIVFETADCSGVEWAIEEAAKIYFKDQMLWNQMRESGMKKNWSWDTPALEYMCIYKKLQQ